jgi:hypothetical protein
MKLRGNRGQVIALYAIALPVLLSVLSLALDGGKLFVIRIHLQNAADASSLASAQDLGDYLNGTATAGQTRTTVEDDVNSYASDNLCGSGSGKHWFRTNPDQRIFGCAVGGASIATCNLAWDAYPNTPVGLQQRSEDTNCYTWPYVKSGAPHWDQVEVRLTKPVNLEFAGIVGFHNPSFPIKRSVATFSPDLLVTTTSTPDQTVVYTDPDTTYTTTTVVDGTTYTTTTVVPGDTHTTTIPASTIINTTTSSTFVGGTGAVAFVKSTDCRADPATATVPAGAAMQWQGASSTLTELIINGGIDVSGTPVKTSDHIWLGKKGVGGGGGLGNCNHIVGSAQIGAITGPFDPLDWPVPPPPAPPAGCRDTGVSAITAAWKTTHGPGIYCWTGTLTVSANSTVFSGYSFYAPQILVNSNSMTVTNASGRPVFYAYGPDKTDPTTGLDACSLANASACALSFNGGSNTFNGDVFVPFGTIVVTGGGAIAGTGFMESLKLLVAGNFAGYNGTGPGDGGGIVTTTETTTTVIPASTQTTTDPDTTLTNTTVSGGSTSTNYSTTAGQTHTNTLFGTTGTSTSTTSTSIGLGE